MRVNHALFRTDRMAHSFFGDVCVGRLIRSLLVSLDDPFCMVKPRNKRSWQALRNLGSVLCWGLDPFFSQHCSTRLGGVAPSYRKHCSWFLGLFGLLQSIFCFLGEGVVGCLICDVMIMCEWGKSRYLRSLVLGSKVCRAPQH